MSLVSKEFMAATLVAGVAGLGAEAAQAERLPNAYEQSVITQSIGASAVEWAKRDPVASAQYPFKDALRIMIVTPAEMLAQPKATATNLGNNGVGHAAEGLAFLEEGKMWLNEEIFTDFPPSYTCGVIDHETGHFIRKDGTHDDDNLYSIMYGKGIPANVIPQVSPLCANLNAVTLYSNKEAVRRALYSSEDVSVRMCRTDKSVPKKKTSSYYCIARYGNKPASPDRYYKVRLKKNAIYNQSGEVSPASVAIHASDKLEWLANKRKGGKVLR